MQLESQWTWIPEAALQRQVSIATGVRLETTKEKKKFYKRYKIQWN